eukprot:scaffold3341_cov165-Ochromonas_danica.AAC.5
MRMLPSHTQSLTHSLTHSGQAHTHTAERPPPLKCCHVFSHLVLISRPPQHRTATVVDHHPGIGN